MNLYNYLFLLQLILFIFLFEEYCIGQKLIQSPGGLFILAQEKNNNNINKRSGIVLLLHGRGGDEQAMWRIFSEKIDTHFYYIVSVRAPFENQRGYEWFAGKGKSSRKMELADEVLESRNRLLHLTQWIKDYYNIDTAAVFVVGFSQGGMMAYSLGLTAPQYYKGIVAIGSRILDETIRHMASIDKCRRVQYLLLHGKKDNIIKPESAEKAAAILSEHNIAYQLIYFDEVHTLSQSIADSAATWLGKFIK